MDIYLLYRSGQGGEKGTNFMSSCRKTIDMATDLDRCTSQAPSIDSIQLTACSGFLTIAVLDGMGLVQDNPPKFHRFTTCCDEEWA